MTYNIGDFIISDKSSKPSVIIFKDSNNGNLLVSIYEYWGDYIWVSKENVSAAILNCEEKLSLLGEFGTWFYNDHKLIYQELIIEKLSN